MEKNKLKILLTISNFESSGSGKVLYDLAKHLDKSKFEVEIACKNSKGNFFNEVKSLNLPIHFINFNQPYQPYYSLFSRVRPFKDFVKRNKYDIIHSWYWSSDWTEALAVCLTRSKFVYTKKSMSWGNIHWKIKSYFSYFIITTNLEMKNFFPNKRNVALIPFGVNTDYFKKQETESSANKHSFNIITVANLVPVKAIEDILKALQLIDIQDVKLKIVGDDQNEYAEYLKKLVVELKLEEQVKFLGKYNDVRPFQNESDLYIISSQREGLPVALLEAMSMRLPVLGSDIPGIRYVLNDFEDLLFEQGNYKQLADKIIYFYKMSIQERNVIGQKMRKHCEDYFSLKKFIERHEELYLKIAKK
ncbi:glycosyltransferase family 1 protein [Flavobacterium piscinae]|uniref:Glycosyltransferase family 1 protein n=1 Tax=Flavobacterium piscinae TaxID=2506424 RepID=A0A4Q1KV78_9FLAO|nr:glycosyltransferase family 4 protein [Flavobacterium piscinae]RXR33074.1 glycosyltransferase family 1 protein [Flavobacterium piscinae]